MTPIVLVAAVAENGVIGRGNALPWRLKSDLQHFKSLTIGRPVVMGRKTYQSIGKPLPGRTNIVVTRDAAFSEPGTVVARSVEDALAIARDDAAKRGADSVAVIGGTEIFRQTVPIAERLELTIVHATPEGDAYWPTVDMSQWRETSRQRQSRGPQDDCEFTYVTYLRKR